MLKDGLLFFDNTSSCYTLTVKEIIDVFYTLFIDPYKHFNVVDSQCTLFICIVIALEK